MENLRFKRNILLVSVAVASLLTSCSDSWLEPKPLSFYTPENTFVDAKGLYSALASCEILMRSEFAGDPGAIITEMVQSDLAVEGTTDKAGPQIDMDNTLLPDANLNHQNTTMVGWYWKEGFNGIKYANTVISRIDKATFDTEDERNAVLGMAYFHRAYRYNKLVHQFGDVPYIDKEIDSPTFDFYSHDRWSILEKLKPELEFAYQWVPENVDRGKTNKSACGVLLMKVCMALGDFDRAIEVGKEIVALHPLMTQRFTANQSKEGTNLMHDLHSVEAKLDMSNTEGLMYVVSYPELENSVRMLTMRQGAPYWNSASIKTPDGQTGTSVALAAEETNPDMDMNKMYGRGIGRLRPTNYFQYTIWTNKEKNDLRGVYNRDSWRDVSDLKYNHPNLYGKSEWYGKNIVKPTALSVEDSIRCWFQWPHYKLFVPDPMNTEWRGGESPWYIYRSAEVYLMMAECYYWKDQLAQAAEQLNVVRNRSGADPLTAADVNIGAILDERARELYYEEARHTELSRIAYTFAKTGKPCEIFGGRVYKLDNFSGPGSANVKETGYNFFYDWVMAKNNFYNKGVKIKFAEYKMSVHHVLWPVPATAINTNLKGVINQNIGYPGTEKNVKPLIVPKDGAIL
jgi:hypothetical protein